MEIFANSVQILPQVYEDQYSYSSYIEESGLFYKADVRKILMYTPVNYENILNTVFFIQVSSNLEANTRLLYQLGELEPVEVIWSFSGTSQDIDSVIVRGNIIPMILTKIDNKYKFNILHMPSLKNTADIDKLTKAVGELTTQVTELNKLSNKVTTLESQVTELNKLPAVVESLSNDLTALIDRVNTLHPENGGA